MAHMGAVKNEEFKAGEVIMSSDAVRASEKCGKDCWVWLALIVAAAAFFRLYDLGMSAFRADTILLWELAKRHVAPALLFTDWFEVSGAAGQMPMPAFIMQLFLSLTGWHVTPAMVRFPFAFFGLITVLAAFFAGRRFGGNRFGLYLSALLAVNSFHIATSREAYFYAMSVFGYFMFFLVSANLADKMWYGRALTWKDALGLAVALFFSAYSQITGLTLCATAGLFLFGLLFWKRRKTPTFKKDLILLIVPHVVILLPLMLAGWGLRPLFAQILQSKNLATQAAAITGDSIFTGFSKAVLQYSWGWSPAGLAIFTAVVLGAAVYCVAKRDLKSVLLVYFIVVQTVLFVLAKGFSGAAYGARYMAGILPFFLAFLVYGLLELPGLVESKLLKNPSRRWLTAVCGAAAIGFCVYPAYLNTQVTGKPTPYFDISRWFDSNMPNGALVLVDRWFEPWNELRSHPSTNVIYTFTIPNEPLETFLQYHWRESAKDFFAKYPDAAYLEIAKTYWDVPSVGPWEWPRSYFANHVTIKNEAGLKLRKLGLTNREDFYAANSNRVVVEVFYNSREDILRRAAAEGRSFVVLYGPRWSYIKTQDYRGWRVLEKEGSLNVYNLTAAPADVALKLQAVAVNGAKHVTASAGQQRADFQAGRIREWTIQPVRLAPGVNEIVLQDPLWGLSQSPLLVDSVECVALTPAP